MLRGCRSEALKQQQQPALGRPAHPRPRACPLCRPTPAALLPSLRVYCRSSSSSSSWSSSRKSSSRAAPAEAGSAQDSQARMQHYTGYLQVGWVCVCVCLGLQEGE